MRRLIPVTDPTTPASSAADREWTLDELADAYAYPEARRPWLRANMVSTLDGAAQHDGRSQGISCASDMRVFGTLRGLADAVVVGAETVRLEGYRPAKAREAFAARREAAGQGPAPAVAVVSASLDLDFSLPLFVSPLVPTLVLTGSAAPSDRVHAAREAGAEVVFAGDGSAVDPARAVAELGRRGLGQAAHRGRAAPARPVRGGGGAGRTLPDPVTAAHRGRRAAHRGRARRLRAGTFRPRLPPGGVGIPLHPVREDLTFSGITRSG